MKTFRHLFYLMMISLLFAACSKDHTMPPLNEPTPPEFGDEYVRVTVEEYKARFKAVDETPVLIEDKLLLKATVVGNDISGNIFKQIFLDDGTSGIVMGVDQNNLYTELALGQEIYLELQGLFVLKYGGQFQIGYSPAQANRIPWEILKNDHLHKAGWPNANKVKNLVFEDFSAFMTGTNSENIVNRPVTLKNVTFIGGGKEAYGQKDGYGERTLKDKQGNAIIVRTSSYAKFALEKLPEGTGTMYGVLGKHNSTWQLALRSIEDQGVFSTEGGNTETPTEKALFHETFGTPQRVGNFWPFVDDYDGYDMAAPIKYSTGDANKVSIRAQGGIGCAWIPGTNDAYFRIEGINTSGKSDLVLSFKINPNLYNPGETIDQSVLQVKIGDQTYRLPAKTLTNEEHKDAFLDISMGNIPQSDNLTVEFFTLGAENNKGFRVANIKIAGKEEGGEIIVPDPEDPNEKPDPQPTGSFLEGFGVTVNKVPGKDDPTKTFWPKVAEYAAVGGFDMKAPVTYTETAGNADIRVLGDNKGNLWMPKGKDVNFIIDGINTTGQGVQKLSFDIAASVFDPGTAIEINSSVLTVSVNGTPFTYTAKELTNANGDANKFYTINAVGDVPEAANVKIEFNVPGTSNTMGLRLDNVKLAK